MSSHVSPVPRKCDSDSLEKRLACLADAGPHAISERLEALEQEWSAGRTTKATLGMLIVAGMALAALHSPYWLVLPLVAGLLLLQYTFTRVSLMGAMFHRLGFRSGAEIDHEKFALKALRGDFRDLATVHEIENKEDISRLEGEGGIVLEPDDSKPDAREVVKHVVQAAKA